MTTDSTAHILGAVGAETTFDNRLKASLQATHTATTPPQIADAVAQLHKFWQHETELVRDRLEREGQAVENQGAMQKLIKKELEAQITAALAQDAEITPLLILDDTKQKTLLAISTIIQSNNHHSYFI